MIRTIARNTEKKEMGFRPAYIWIVFFCASLGASSALGAADSVVECVTRAVSELVVKTPKHDSAVELEMDLNPQLMDILTTEDGTIGPVLRGRRTPRSIIDSIKKNNIQSGKISSTPWDGLSYELKMDVIRAGAKDQSFSEDREAHGLVVRKKIKMRFDGKPETVFLGKSYKPGEYEVDVSSVMGEKVEFISPKRLPNADGLEIHFRGNLRAGDLSAEARIFQKGIGAAVTDQHVHIVAPLPTEKLAADPALQSAVMGDFVRRVQLLTEAFSIRKGVPIRKVDDGEATFFSSFDDKEISGITQYFFDVGHGHNAALTDDFKMGWVGFRGSDKYDQPGLWGLEVRGISAEDDPEENRVLLNNLQWHMTKQDYGIGEKRISNWLKRIQGHASASPAQRVGESWYNQDVHALLALAPDDLNEVLTDEGREKFKNISEENREVKMLLFNWSKDPLFYDNPKALEKIRFAQQVGIHRLQQGSLTPNEIMQQFLTDSGIEAQVVESFGMSPNPKKRSKRQTSPQ